jgi:hypothetical protein
MHYKKFSVVFFNVLTAYYPFILILLKISVAKNGNLTMLHKSHFDFLKVFEGFKWWQKVDDRQRASDSLIRCAHIF